MKKLQIERKKRLSQSALCRLQRNFFKNKGIDAWAEKTIPYFVTSNCFAAECYANVVISFISDWLKQYPESAAQTFYILEMGAGPGQFSFYMLNMLTKLQQSFLLTEVKIKYIMSDLASSNIEYWKQHSGFKSFIEKGMLDFSIYDLEHDRSMHLIHAKRNLLPKDIRNPLIAFSNYLFDSMGNDVFRVVEDDLQELRVSLYTESSNMSQGCPVFADKVDVEYHACHLPNICYQDADFEAVLRHQLNTLNNTYLLMPIAALNGIKNLNHLSNGKLLLLASDKGYTHIKSLDNLGKPHFAMHGSFSVMVNFYAVSEYVKRLGGQSYVQTPRRGIKTLAYALGWEINDTFSATQRALDQYIQRFSLADYFLLHRHITASDEPLNLGLAVAHLKLGNYDPYVFSKLSKRIQKVLEDTEYVTQVALKDILPKISEHYYFIPRSQDTNFDIALVHHLLKEYTAALKYYDKSREQFGETYNVYYNSALCAYYAGDTSTALNYFKRAGSLNPDAKEAQEWMMYLGEEEKG
jgi:tetratricopeptide (TPR) repeat protein